MQRMSVKEAAERLGVTEGFIRYQMRVNRMPIGMATRSREGGGSFRYIIYKEKLEEFEREGMEKWLRNI